MIREDILRRHLSLPEEQSNYRRNAQTPDSDDRRKLNRTMMEQEESFRKPYQKIGGI